MNNITHKLGKATPVTRKLPIAGWAAAALLGGLAAQPAQAAAADAPAATAAWTPTRLADGQPDAQGFWRPERAGTYSLLLGHVWGGGVAEVLRERELAQAGKPLPYWPSRIIDPADGQIPYQAWARAKQKDVETNVDHPKRQEHLDPQERCFPDGPVRAQIWAGVEIQQFPGYVVLRQEGNHTWRVVPLDGRPHAPGAIKLWMSDSRGHWEGRTLVIDVTNSNSKGRLDHLGDFASDQVHITERYTFNDDKSFDYRATFVDPTVYTRPWTLAVKFLRAHTDEPGYEAWEQECQEHEKNSADYIVNAAPPGPGRATP
jgi:hypothetical protein